MRLSGTALVIRASSDIGAAYAAALAIAGLDLVLVNNAGYNGSAPFLKAEYASLAGVVALDVTAPRLFARATLGCPW